MIRDNVLSALEDGYDVILEGIFTVKSYKSVFEEIFSKHPRQNHIFYFDISFKETINRHATRESKNLFTENDMKSWYIPNDLMGFSLEHVIAEQSSLEETVEEILSRTKLPD